MPTLTEIMRSSVPEGQSGNWSVERFEVDSMGSALSLFSLGARAPAPGTYTALKCGRAVVMSDTPAECRDHFAPYREAKTRGGDVLIHGLGLGVLLGAILNLDNVTGIDVVEISEDVIALVAPHFTDPRVTIHHGDALTYRFPAGKRWSVVWHDIWPDICADNLPQMATLHRRYGRRCDWQGSWAKGLCRR